MVSPLSAELQAQLEKAQEQVCHEAGAYLEQVAGRLRARSIQVSTQVVVADRPATAILEEAVPQHIDLVAIQTHGRHGLGRLVLGSVADKVIRGAAVPVLVQRPKGR